MSTEHRNQHSHDENCQCGCHDEHQHSKPQHHHEHQHEAQAITVKTHETSIVGSYQFDLDQPFDEAQLILDTLLKQVAKEVTDLGGIIGHIKAFLNSEGKNCMLSITEDDSQKHYGEGSHCHVEGVAIVFCIRPEQLENILNNVFSGQLINLHSTN